jgi:hypothetical protein
MYFLARYQNGSYRVSEMGFPTLEMAQAAGKAMFLEMGFRWVVVAFPRMEQAVAA